MNGFNRVITHGNSHQAWKLLAGASPPSWLPTATQDADAVLDRPHVQTSAHRHQFSGHPSTPDISSLSSSASPRGTPMRAFRRADMTNC